MGLSVAVAGGPEGDTSPRADKVGTGVKDHALLLSRTWREAEELIAVTLGYLEME